MANVEIIRDLTESFLAKFIENDVSGSYDLASQSQLSTAIKAAVRAFKFSLNIQLGHNPLTQDMPSLKLAEADDPGGEFSEETRVVGTSEKVSHRSSLFVTCFDRLGQFRRQSQAIDVVIKTGPLRIGAHKIVLAAAVPFFQGLFLSPVAPTSSEIDLDIPGVDSKVIISIVQWAYSGEIVMTNSTVQSLLIAAGYLGCEPVIAAACSFIERRMNNENVLEVIQVAESLSCTKLATKARQYVDRYFLDLTNLPSWLQSPPELVSSILASSSLYVEKESIVWDAFRRWISENIDSADFKLAEMLANVRLHLLQPQFIRDEVLSYAPVSNDIQCRNQIDEAILRHCNVDFPKATLTDPDDDGILVDVDRLNPRYCSHLHNRVYLLGGFASNAVHESIDTVDMFDPQTKTWKQMPQMRRCRGRLGVAVMNGKLYALGGFDCAVRLKSAEVYDPETNKWSEISDMINSRSAPACSAMNGRLYVCGGYNGESCLASCESYDPQRNVWEQLPSMQRARSAAAAICFAGQMFVTGGCDVVQFFDSVEVFDGKQWGELKSMSATRCRHGSIVFQGQIWVIGGYNGRFLQSVEQYSFATGQWTPMVTTMNVRRGRVGVVTSDNKVYAIGGYDGMTNLTTIEIYDPEEGTWSLAGNMGRHEGGVGVAALPMNCSWWK